MLEIMIFMILTVCQWSWWPLCMCMVIWMYLQCTFESGFKITFAVFVVPLRTVSFKMFTSLPAPPPTNQLVYLPSPLQCCCLPCRCILLLCSVVFFIVFSGLVWRVDDLAVFHIVFSNDFHFHCFYCFLSATIILSVWNWQCVRNNNPSLVVMDDFSESGVNADVPFGNRNNEGEKSNKCNQCNFASFWAGNLRTHLKTHSGEKPNKCNQCGYATSLAGNLRVHLKTHSGEKPNKCNQCDYVFSRACDLRTHMKTHSGEKSNKCN